MGGASFVTHLPPPLPPTYTQNIDQPDLLKCEVKILRSIKHYAIISLKVGGGFSHFSLQFRTLTPPPPCRKCMRAPSLCT